jgi:hypothetical protein
MGVSGRRPRVGTVVLIGALDGPHTERARADDEQDSNEDEAGRVVGLPEHGRGNAEGGNAQRGGEVSRSSY